MFCLLFTTDANFDEHLGKPSYHQEDGNDESIFLRTEDDPSERVEDELECLHSASPYIVSPVNKYRQVLESHNPVVSPSPPSL